MNESWQAQSHERWYKTAHSDFRQHLQDLTYLWVSRQLLMLLTLEPPLWESLRQAEQNLPSGTLQGFRLDFGSTSMDDDCRNPPADEALLETVTELAYIASSFDALKTLRLYETNTSIQSLFLAACPRLECLDLALCCLRTANVQSLFSIRTPRELILDSVDFPSPASISGFCL